MEGRNFERREGGDETHESISFLKKNENKILAIFGKERSAYIERFLDRDLFVPKNELLHKARESGRIDEDNYRRLLKACGIIVDRKAWQAERYLGRPIDKGNVEKTPSYEIKGENLRRNIALMIGKVVTGKPGSNLMQLFKLLRSEPQIDDNGNIRYLVTSGCAVELITGFKRSHHDLDLVILDNPSADNWEIYGTENVTSEKYWADMVFDSEFLSNTSISILNNELEVLVVHPAILLVQKLSNAFGRPPRDKDWADAKALIKFWGSEVRYGNDWEPIIIAALEALPDDQVELTKERLVSLM